MAWFLNFMLGKGAPTNGASSFTYKSLNGTMGRPYKFTDKEPSTGVVPSLFFILLTQRDKK